MPRTIDQRVLQAASVVLAVLLVAGLAVGVGVLAPTGPASASDPAPRGSHQTAAPDALVALGSMSPSRVTATPTGTPEPTHGSPIATTIPHDAIAAVTEAGGGLRVRTEPGVGKDSRKLEPLLARDARMLVVDGPVAADGYDWYQVMVDPQGANLFGWVAAGKDGETWIERVEPQCSETDTPVVLIPAIEYVACFGDDPVRTTLAFIEGLGPLSEGATAEGYLCSQLAEPDRCHATVDWLQVPNYQVYLGGDESDWITADVAMPWEWEGTLRDMVPVPVIGGRDAPEARDCRVVDRKTGLDVIPRAEAITRCRLAFVVREVDGQR